MITILFCEDEKEIRELVASYLKSENYNVFPCPDGESGLTVFENNKIDIVLSDIMMPKMDGYELAKNIRAINTSVPIIFLSAKDDKLSKQYGYKTGIDDYITKPFDIDELLFKIKAIARRLNIQESSKLVVGNLVLDKEEHSAYIDGNEVSFTVREFDILYKLLSFPKKTFTRSKLMDEFWDYDSSATSRTVDVYMAKIREKTSKCDGFEIVTMHGLGYKVVLNEKE